VTSNAASLEKLDQIDSSENTRKALANFNIFEDG
jgi:hypothetical protein